jgi:hypothetical protein
MTSIMGVVIASASLLGGGIADALTETSGLSRPRIRSLDSLDSRMRYVVRESV